MKQRSFGLEPQADESLATLCAAGSLVVGPDLWKVLVYLVFVRPEASELCQKLLKKHRAAAVFLLHRHLSFRPWRPDAPFWHDVAAGHHRFPCRRSMAL